MKKAYLITLIPTGHGRGGELVRDIAWAGDSATAKAMAEFHNPGCRVFAIRDASADVGGPF